MARFVPLTRYSPGRYDAVRERNMTEKKTVLRGITVSSLFLFGAWAGTSAAAQDLEKIQIRPVRIAENYHVLMGAGGNVSVLTGPDGILLVDDGVAQLIEKVRAEVAKLGAGPVRFVLNTNWHYDHVDGNERLAKEGALIIAHANSRKRMLAEQRIPELDPNFRLQPYPEAALPKITVDEVMGLHVNGEDIRIEHIAGAHSEGDLIFHFPKADVIHAGDIFFSDGYPFIHISGGGSVGGMIAAVDKILAMAGERTKIIPGHGLPSDRQGLKEYRDLLAAARDRIAALVREGKTLDEIQKADPLAGLYEKGTSSFPASEFLKLVFMDLTGKR